MTNMQSMTRSPYMIVSRSHNGTKIRIPYRDSELFWQAMKVFGDFKVAVKGYGPDGFVAETVDCNGDCLV